MWILRSPPPTGRPLPPAAGVRPAPLSPRLVVPPWLCELQVSGSSHTCIPPTLGTGSHLSLRSCALSPSPGTGAGDLVDVSAPLHLNSHGLFSAPGGRLLLLPQPSQLLAAFSPPGSFCTPSARVEQAGVGRTPSDFVLVPPIPEGFSLHPLCGHYHRSQPLPSPKDLFSFVLLPRELDHHGFANGERGWRRWDHLQIL